jgi:hypothetical protein
MTFMKTLAGMADLNISKETDHPMAKRKRQVKDLSSAHRGIVTLALALVISFLLLAYFDSQLFFIHLYESLIYLAIVATLFALEERWTYMLGMLAPAVWLMLMLIPGACTVLFFAVGGIPEILRPVQLVFHLQRASFPASILGIIILILSMSMFIFCASRWRSEFVDLGRGRGWTTFLVCFGVVGIYYGAMVLWALQHLRPIA